MKVTFKLDGKNAYTPKFRTFNGDNGKGLYFGIFVSQENETEDGVLWMADDVINNFESLSIELDSIIIKTTDNAFILKSSFVKKLPKGKVFTGIVYVDDNAQYIDREYRRIAFENE